MAQAYFTATRKMEEGETNAGQKVDINMQILCIQRCYFGLFFNILKKLYRYAEIDFNNKEVISLIFMMNL